MKIAYDGTVLHGRMSGVGYYAHELLDQMAVLDPGTEFRVFSHQPPPVEENRLNGRVRWAEGPFFPVRAFYMHAMLPAWLRREKPDLIHFTNFLAPWAEVGPYVVTIHDMSLERMASGHPWMKRLYTRRLIPRSAERAELIITNSEFSKWDIVRYLGISEDRIRVTPLGVGPEFHPVPPDRRAAVLSRLGIAEPYFLYVGNIEPRKNLNRLIDAFKRADAGEATLVIAGGGWYRSNDAARHASRQGVSHRIRFQGYVDRADLPALYSGAIATVYPSLLEGFGLPVAEAMACGSAVITSNGSSLKEIAGDAGLLVDPTDVSALADSLSGLFRDSAARAALARKGLDRSGLFDWKRTAALTLDVYREALDRRRGAVRAARPAPPASPDVRLRSVEQAVRYAGVFQYPLTVEELRERLAGVAMTAEELVVVLERSTLPRRDGFITADPGYVDLRRSREAFTDQMIHRAWPLLERLCRMPYVRLVALSGATAHRNVEESGDLDLFVAVEHNRVWLVLLLTTVWARWHGVRRWFCLNYFVSDRALAVPEHDPFTAQQIASLKPLYGLPVYDRLIQSNPFVTRHFPNFAAGLHRGAYPSIQAPRSKRWMEFLGRFGPAQIGERISRLLMRPYLARKAAAAGASEPDVVLDVRRIKLHMPSHRHALLPHFDQ